MRLPEYNDWDEDLDRTAVESLCAMLLVGCLVAGLAGYVVSLFN